MAQRDDVTALHEPFNDCYYFSRGRKTDEYGVHALALGYDGPAARRSILGHATPLVYFKEMAYIGLPYVTEEFLGGIANTFLIREPAQVMRSLRAIRPDFTREHFGFDALGELWGLVTGTLGQRPIVVESDALCRRPEEVLRRYCGRLGIEFQAACLSWPRGDVRRWQPHEELAHRRWHSALADSTRFIPPGPPARDEPPPTAPERDMLDDARALYRRLLEHAIA
jgi:hypothetical protein